jgi:hypothetical protein
MERIVPLSMPQRQLVEFMVLHPKFFTRLEEGGIRDCLAGGVGEIVFLQLKNLLVKNPEAEPEELLTVLSEGVERTLVADLLLRASNCRAARGEDASRAEFSDLIDYLAKYHLKKSSEELMARMQRAQQEGDLALLQELMGEKIALTRKLHGEQI